MAKNEKVETLEKGNIYFFYRPKVEEEDPQSLSDVQRLYMVLSPEEGRKFRLAIIGRKRLTDPSRQGRGRNWGFIDRVGDTSEIIREELKGDTYDTKTRGKRHLPVARPLGEGIYRLLRHSGHTHLVYALELPEKPGEAQEETRIEKEASYIISVKNPEKGSPQATGLSKDRKPEYPKYLREKFRDRRFADADPPAFLDREGTEFLLISASGDVEEELGLELHPRDETVNTADIFKELRLDKSSRPLKPLLEGKWD